MYCPKVKKLGFGQVSLMVFDLQGISISITSWLYDVTRPFLVA